jgi:hypothetical protein
MKNGFHEVIQRFRAALGLKSDKEIAAALGMKPNAFYNRRQSESLPYAELLVALEQHKMRSDWLFFGIGSPFHDPATELRSPVSGDIQPVIFQEICYELERAFSGAEDKKNDEAAAEASIKGGLAALIYQQVAHMEQATLRRLVIRNEAASFASARKIFMNLPPSPEMPKTEKKRARAIRR